MTELMRRVTKQDIRNTLSICIVALCFWFMFKLLAKPIPPENKDAVILLGGILFGGFSMVVGYFFGTTKSEVDAARKDQ